VSPNELLTLVGLAWSRLLLDPGGLALLVLIWRIWRAGRPASDTPCYAGNGAAGLRLVSPSAIVLPWLGLALVPAPSATPLSRSTDLIVVLALFEWPRIVAIARDLHSTDRAAAAAGWRRLAAALNSYPVLIVATIALAQSAGSFDIAALARAPVAAAPLSVHVLHWVGALAWALGLPALVGCGPFRAWEPGTRPGSPPPDGVGWGLGVRACGLVLLAGLPWLAPFGALETEGSYEWPALVAIAAVPAALAALLWGFDRLTRRQPARQWAWGYLILSGLVLLALLGAAYAAFPSLKPAE
jgi:hypothetical protein